MKKGIIKKLRGTRYHLREECIQYPADWDVMDRWCDCYKDGCEYGVSGLFSRSFDVHLYETDHEGLVEIDVFSFRFNIRTSGWVMLGHRHRELFGLDRCVECTTKKAAVGLLKQNIREVLS